MISSVIFSWILTLMDVTCDDYDIEHLDLDHIHQHLDKLGLDYPGRYLPRLPPPPKMPSPNMDIWKKSPCWFHSTFFVITSCSTRRNFDRALFHCKDTRSLKACQKINVTAQTIRLKNIRCDNKNKKIKSLPYYCLFRNRD